MCAFTVSGSHEMRGNRRRGGEEEGEGVTGGVGGDEHGGGDGNPRHVFTVLIVRVPGTICFRKHTSRRTELARFLIAGQRVATLVD